MKNYLRRVLFVVTFFVLACGTARAVVNNTVKVGLRYGSSAMFSANLENAVGSGYDFGYFDEARDFVSLGETDRTAISMTAAGTVYVDGSGNYSASAPSGSYQTLGAWHVELEGFRTFAAAAEEARSLGGYPAWIDGTYVVRVGCYDSRAQAESAAAELGGTARSSTSSGVLVTRTRTTEVLFEFEGGNLGVRPHSQGGESATWFRGYKYAGAFEYPRVRGGNLMVWNVVDLEAYVKGVAPYEMGGAWPLEALKAQAVCARTYVCANGKHLSAYGFDVCATTDCQVYYGLGSGAMAPTANSDRAVEETAGECLYYGGALTRDPVYHASDGGATEDAGNVWGGSTGYLIGKADPYESRTGIPNYRYSVTYTAAELTWILEQKGYGVGTVRDVYISAYTPMGNVKEVTFAGSGGTKTVSGETCRTIFYSSTYGKSVPSLRFEINGGSGGEAGRVLYVNGERMASLDGAYAISAGGVSRLEGDGVYGVSASGTAPLASGQTAVRQMLSPNDGTFTITGTGSGHNVGMSQYGAKVMAELGYGYQEILRFYYTDVDVRTYR